VKHEEEKLYATREEFDYPMKLSAIIDLELLAQEIADGYINCSAHPMDPNLKILCYGKLTQILGRWNEATKQCRGLIVRSEGEDFSDAELIARPWRKFFTLQQVQSGWALGDEEEGTVIEQDIASLDFEAPAEVTDKLDGSLLVLYRHPDGRPAFSTKGCFDSEQATFFSKLLRGDPKYSKAAEKLLRERVGVTYLFEGVGPFNQIVLAYPEDEIVLLGSVVNETGEYLSAADVSDIWEAGGHKSCELLPAQNLREAVNMADRQGKEGVVIRILSADPEKQMMIKVKQQDYLALHRLVTGFGEAAVREAIVSSKVTFADLDRIAAAGSSLELAEVRKVVEFDDSPVFQNVRNRRREQFDEALVPAAKAAVRAKSYIVSLPQADFDGDPREAKKKFALGIDGAVEKTGAPQAVLFILATARIAGRDMDSLDASAVMKAAAKTVRRNTSE